MRLTWVWRHGGATNKPSAFYRCCTPVPADLTQVNSIAKHQQKNYFRRHIGADEPEYRHERQVFYDSTK